MLFIDGIVFSLQKSGGISVYFNEIFSRVCKSGSPFFLKLYNKFDLNGNFNHDINNFKSSTIVEPGRLLERYRDVQLNELATVFHSSYYRLPVKKQRSNVKIVTTVHDFTYEKFGRGISKFVHCFQKRRAVLNSDVIVCISENTKNDLLKYIPEAEGKNIQVVYNGVSDIFYYDESIEVTNKVIFVGSRVGYKNFSIVVEALALKPEFSLTIIGGGELNKSEQALLENNLPGRYEYLGFIDDEELALLYNKAFCLIYPSLYEGFGIPALEAMRSGCPVIATNSSSLPEVCGGAALLMDNPSAETISSSVEKLQIDVTRKLFVEKGLENASRFSWDETFNKINDIYLG